MASLKINILQSDQTVSLLSLYDISGLYMFQVSPSKCKAMQEVQSRTKRIIFLFVNYTKQTVGKLMMCSLTFPTIVHGERERERERRERERERRDREREEIRIDRERERERER